MPLAEGDFEKTLQTLLDPNWDIDNLYLVGIVHRDGKLGGKRMHVFNTAKGNIVDATSIHEIKNEKLKMKNDVYDLTGRKVAKPTNGIYINGNKKVVIRNS